MPTRRRFNRMAPTRPSRATRRAAAVLFLAFAPSSVDRTSAGPINTDVAFTPRKGGAILRLQYVYTELDGKARSGMTRGANVRSTFVYGLRKDVALFLTAPYVHRDIDARDAEDKPIERTVDGLGDIGLLLKHRFWQHDIGPQQTTRAAWLGGIELRSGDTDVSSDSYDPIAGAVFSWRRDRQYFDADLLYKFNTGGGRRRHDRLRYDLAYSYRIAPDVFRVDDPFSLNVVLEMNGVYTTDGSHEVFLAPGVQWATEQWTFEASIQLPVVQEVSDAAVETDYRVVFGVKFSW